MFNLYSTASSTAQLPRILAEDVGAPELRNPMLCTKKPFKLHLPKQQAQQEAESCTCSRTKLCTAGAN